MDCTKIGHLLILNYKSTFVYRINKETFSLKLNILKQIFKHYVKFSKQKTMKS